jgi:hypothetical protein
MHRLTESYPSQHALGGVKGVVAGTFSWTDKDVPFVSSNQTYIKERVCIFCQKTYFLPPSKFFFLPYNLLCVYGPPHALFCLYFPLICFSFVFLLPFFFNISLSPVNCFSNGRGSCYLPIVIR